MGTTSPAIPAITAARPAMAANRSSNPAAARARNRSTPAVSDRDTFLKPDNAHDRRGRRHAPDPVPAFPAVACRAGDNAESALPGGEPAGFVVERREIRGGAAVEHRHRDRRDFGAREILSPRVGLASIIVR